jgi:hypothetical protein
MWLTDNYAYTNPFLEPVSLEALAIPMRFVFDARIGRNGPRLVGGRPQRRRSARSRHIEPANVG